MRRGRLLIQILVTAVVTIALLAASCSEESPQGPEGSDGNSVDTIAPAAVTDLIIQTATRNSLALQWPAPGDDGMTGRASRYDIRYADSVITDENWDTATPAGDVPSPKTGGQVEIFVVKGLMSNHDYYFALKTYDEVDNESPLSNCASKRTENESQPPAAVGDLSAIGISDAAYLLTWTATGDDGVGGTAFEYDVRYSASATVVTEFESADRATGEPTPSPAGTPESLLVTVPDGSRTYYFALKVADEVPNWSDLSNVTRGFSIHERLLAYPWEVQLPDAPGVQVYFRLLESADVAITISAVRYDWPYDIIVVKHLLHNVYPAGIHHTFWDLTTDDDERISPPPDWDIQANVRLHIGGAIVDSTLVRVYADTTSVRTYPAQ